VLWYNIYEEEGTLEWGRSYSDAWGTTRSVAGTHL